jgi:hypothetical protein
LPVASGTGCDYAPRVAVSALLQRKHGFESLGHANKIKGLFARNLFSVPKVSPRADSGRATEAPYLTG